MTKEHAEHIVKVLRELEAGSSTDALKVKYGLYPQTILNWKRMYKGLSADEIVIKDSALRKARRARHNGNPG